MALRTRTTARAVVVAATVALLAAGCGGDEGAPAAGPSGPVGEITITSPDVSFDVEAFEVAAGEEVAVTYENRDDGVRHNLRFDTGVEPEPASEVAEGPVTQQLVLTIDEPGEVTYVCDVHPAQMRGTVTAR